MAAVVLMGWTLFISYRRFLVEEVGVREYSLPTLITSGRLLPGEVLQGWQDVACVVVDNKFRTHLLGHELLRRRHSGG